MLREPEASLVRAYLEAGGKIKRVPFGISGQVYGFRSIYAEYGMRGWLQRFGIRHLPDDCLPFVMSGQLSVPAARAELVWDMIRANDTNATIGALSRALGLPHRVIEHTLAVLEHHRLVRRVGNSRPARFAVQGPAPRWLDFIRQERSGNEAA